MCPIVDALYQKVLQDIKRYFEVVIGFLTCIEFHQPNHNIPQLKPYYSWFWLILASLMQFDACSEFLNMAHIADLVFTAQLLKANLDI